MDPFEPFASAHKPWSTDFGDDLFSGLTILSGHYLEIVSQPTYGTVTVSTPTNPTGWRIDTAPVPAPVAGRSDQWTFWITDGTNHADPVTVPLSYQDLDA